MTGYRTFKTTMGRKYKVRMTDDELAERELFYIVLTVFPFMASVGMFLLWIKMG